ncbi:MAG: FTR1 family protein [Gemmatimonadetes bacterium]|nr:FTR1 family protein [Gemmatimonadota bacterium]
MTDSLSVARRVVAAASLAAKEYTLGVPPAGGRITQPDEVDEARLFIDQARFDVALLPAAVRAGADSQLGAIRRLLDHLAPPAEVERSARALIEAISAATGGGLDPLPTRRPSLARGGQVYREQCASCHGDQGRGDGSKSQTVEGPPPANLADLAVMGSVTQQDIYRKILIGVAGTAMPEFGETLSEEDRWAVTAYVATLQYGGSAAAATLAAVRRAVDSALTLRSDKVAFDAYLAFEQVEGDVQARNPALARELETAFAELRARAGVGTPEELAAIRGRVFAALERAERLVVDKTSTANLLAQSFFLLLREGFEAILIVGALMAFLTKAGAPERRRDVALGAWWAVAASVASWILVEALFTISPAQREALEGVTMLLATIVLFSVSYWLLSKIEAAKWTAFVRKKMQGALSRGSGLALASVAFLAVYREGLETILFYKALFSSGGAQSAGAAVVASGIALGAVALVALYAAINYFGLKVPMKPFFAVTGAMLYYMAFVFAGKGIAALQTAGIMPLTALGWAPRVPQLGIYPTLESLVLQGTLFVLAGFALVWSATRPVKPVAVSRQPSVRELV